jgi:oligopeptide transport system substrate-binding protein
MMLHLKLKTLFTSAALCALVSTSAFAGGTWNRGANGDVQSLDPHKTATVEEANILRDLFMGLVTEDADGNLLPGAAESWTVSPDGKSYVFKLRKDDVWSDGTPVTANDFVFSWRRVVDAKTASEYASMAYPVLNAEQVNSGKAKPEEMGVKAVDANTLEVTPQRPNALLPRNAYPPSHVSRERSQCYQVRQ